MMPRRSVRDMRFASRRGMGSARSASTSAAVSVGKVSPGNRVSLPIPERDSRIDVHTSCLFRPIAQITPTPVTAIRVVGSALRIAEIEPSAYDFYSVDRARTAEAIQPAERSFEGHGDPHGLANGGQPVD